MADEEPKIEEVPAETPAAEEAPAPGQAENEISHYEKYIKKSFL